MAKDKKETSKPILERVYVIPLRRETLKVPYFRKANKAAKTVRLFIKRHMKSENISIGKYLNLQIWKHGAKNPPHHVKVNAVKDDKGKVTVELVGAPKESPKEEKKAGKKEDKTVKEAEFKEMPEKKLEKQVEEAKEEKAEEAKKIEKEEIKELKKEHHPQHAPKMPAKPKLQESRPTAPRSV